MVNDPELEAPMEHCTVVYRLYDVIYPQRVIRVFKHGVSYTKTLTGQLVV